MKTVYIIHGWDNSPDKPIHRWLKFELEKNGFKVVVPSMPHPKKPTIEDWVAKIKDVVEQPDGDVILVGHSIGCQTILRYLEKLDSTVTVGGVVLIAPWLTLSNIDEAGQRIAGPWLETPINEMEVIKHAPKIVAIFSDNDPYVPIENRKLFEHAFGAETIVESGKGHFTESDGVVTLPSALEVILKMK